MGNCWPKPVTTTTPPPPNSGNDKGTSKNKNDRRARPTTFSVAGNNYNPPSSSLVYHHHPRHVEHLEKVQVQGASPPPPTSATTTSNGGRDIVSNSNDAPTSSSTSTTNGSPRNLKKFSYAELRTATRNFRPDTVLGEGGFGRVFKGWIDEKTYAPSRVGVGMPVAVKKSNPDSEQGLNEWQAEVRFLGKFCHENLVKLLGYCWEDREFLLVYEYMQRGSLESHLFRRGGGGGGAETLSWETRLKIAVDAARGLEFLHSTEKQVIYRDFKSSNILLDVNFNAKLSDFGLAKLGPVDGDSHVTTQVVGTYGYAAPEYMATGHLYVKSDVYGFGVVLLEIISGRRVLDLNQPTGQHNLVDWAKPLLPEKRRLRQLIDPNLEGQYPLRAAVQIAELILQCLEPDPKKRPSMEQVLETLQEVSCVEMKSKDRSKKQAQNQKHQQPSSNHHNNNRHHQRSPTPPPLPTKNPSAGSIQAGPRQKLPIQRSY